MSKKNFIRSQMKIIRAVILDQIWQLVEVNRNNLGCRDMCNTHNLQYILNQFELADT